LKLYWKKLKPSAKAPTVAHPGTDLGYDVYAAETVALMPGRVTLVSTGIAIEFEPAHGAILKDRSSLASKGIRTSAGVIDCGYRGEIRVAMTLDTDAPARSDRVQDGAYMVREGDKIAQLVPVKPLTMFEVEQSEVLSETKRGEGGFGSTGN
jgi:dUTP pyrophosphatase